MKGRDIIAAAPPMLSDSWPVVSRTKLIDDLITDAIARGCNRVLNLAAGLDTRPYRLDLRPELAWIEADLPTLLDEKQTLLADEPALLVLTGAHNEHDRGVLGEDD